MRAPKSSIANKLIKHAEEVLPMTEEIERQGSQFGGYLRYWRTAKAVSQEELAHELNCSVKHISFLENGRTRPSQSLIMRLEETLTLSKVDVNNLLISAGFRAERGLIENLPSELEFRDKSLALMLENIGASPALIRDRFGNIKMMNKACVVLWREWLGDALDDPSLMNTYRLFFSDRGWRPFVEGWEQIAVILLTTLDQERMLAPDKSADLLIEELSSLPGVPKGWKQQDNDYTKRSSFFISLRDSNRNESSLSLVCTSTIGNLSQNIASSLALECHCHFDQDPPYNAVEISNMQGVSHPLLPY